MPQLFHAFLSAQLQLRSSSLPLTSLRSSQTPPIHPLVLQMLVSLLVVPLATLHVSMLSLPLRQHDGLLRGFERFTPDPAEGSCAIGTASSELLRRFDSWSSRASSAPVSMKSFRCRNRPHRVRYRCRKNSFSAFRRVPTFVIPHACRHQRKSTFQLSQVRLRIIQRTHTPLTMMTLHSVWMQSNHLI